MEAAALPNAVTGATIGKPSAFMPTFPEWWTWDLSFTAHPEMRMEQRGVTEVEVAQCWRGPRRSIPTSWRADS